MCSKQCTFCHVFIMASDYQEGPWKKKPLSNGKRVMFGQQYSKNCMRKNCFVCAHDKQWTEFRKFLSYSKFAW